MNFSVPDMSDKRIIYAAEALQNKGFQRVSSNDKADFILLGVNPDKQYLDTPLPIFAGNVSKDNVQDYTKSESFAIYNAYLTAEAAIALAVTQSDISLIHSRILICGYGRIAKALHHYLEHYTNCITVCARSSDQLTQAAMRGADAVELSALQDQLEQDFIFNTVPHMIFDYETLAHTDSEARLIDLASFPGGVDIHAARVLGVNFITARGLPAKYAPKSAGYAVADAVEELLKEELT